MKPIANNPTQDSTHSTAKTATALLELIHELGDELHIRPAQLQALSLDSSFDYDLGLDSLARLECLSRIEAQFDVALPEQVFADIETPRELLREILAAEHRQDNRISSEVETLTLEASHSVPHSATTLIELLEWHVQTHADRPHIKLYHDNDQEEKIITYRDLQQGAQTIASGLQQIGLEPRQAVSIMLPTGQNYFFTFFGILIAGGVPVPIYPPARMSQLEDHLMRHQRILANCQAALLITVDEARPVARLLKAQVNTLKHIVTPEDLSHSDGTLLHPRMQADDIAFLQYTSGSTGTPKGVTLTHSNLLNNIRAMGERLAVDANDVFVSWLPLYHDMGLIGAWLGSLYYAALLVVMSPLTFLAKPNRWLWAIHRNRATLTAAPNFAYELCLKRIHDANIQGVKLGSLRAMFNGAEPVRAATLVQFYHRFEPYGLQPEALKPVYGLAECSVGLAFPPLNRCPLIDSIQREHYMRTGIAKPVTDDDNALQFVACGQPLSGHEIRIVDHADRELPERQEGRLQFRGPSTTSGYFHNPEKTRELFHDDWLESGDLAYMADGDVYITGRIKDLIIHAGRNIYPQDLEEAVSEINGVRKGCVAVFGSPDSDSVTERLVVLVETRMTQPDQLEQLHSSINQVCTQLIGTAPDEIVLAPAHTVLKTSSGKIRRGACRELFEQDLIASQQSNPVWKQLSRLMLASGIPQLRRSVQAILAALYAAYAWLLFLPVAVITWLLVVICPGRQWRWRIMRTAARCLAFAARIPVNIRGLENIPAQDQSSVWVCNHCSYLDGLALVHSVPRMFSFVAKAELAQQTIAGTFLRKINTEFVERLHQQQSVDDAKKIAQVTDNGRMLLFFPEGTFTRMSGLLAFHMGAFTTAAQANLPVIPIAIRGTRSILRAGSWFPRRGSISIVIGAAICPDQSISNQKTDDLWRQALLLRDAGREHILRYCGEPDLSHEKSFYAVMGSDPKKKKTNI